MSSIGTVCCNFLDDFQNKTGENIELFLYFSPVKQEIKKVWPYNKYVFVSLVNMFL